MPRPGLNQTQREILDALLNTATVEHLCLGFDCDPAWIEPKLERLVERGLVRRVNGVRWALTREGRAEHAASMVEA